MYAVANGIRHFQRHRIMSREGMSEYPPWVPPEVMKERLLWLLNQYKDKQLADDHYLGNMVLETGADGVSSWVCFQGTGTLQRARRSVCLDLNDLLYAVVGHASQWCQENVVDATGAKVARQDRIVLNPQYLMRQAGKPCEAIIAALEKVTVCPVRSGMWRQWEGVVNWQSRLSSARQPGSAGQS